MNILIKNGLTTLWILSPLPIQATQLCKSAAILNNRLYKRAVELRHRAAEVVKIIAMGNPDLGDFSIVKGFPALDVTFLSASQHRKSRAGRSFEQHIARLLQDGRVDV